MTPRVRPARKTTLKRPTGGGDKGPPKRAPSRSFPAKKRAKKKQKNGGNPKEPTAGPPREQQPSAVHPGKGVAEEFVCPITRELPVDPVMAEDG